MISYQTDGKGVLENIYHKVLKGVRNIPKNNVEVKTPAN
jgi:hypothetical protein